MSRKFLTPIVLPADPVAAMEATTKQYVDSLASGGGSGVSWKAPVRVTGGPFTNFNFMSGLATIDGVTLVDGDRVLLVGQNTATNNGIWVAHSGAWVRATDADSGAKLNGMVVYVTEGTTYSDSTWVLKTNAPITVGTTALAYALMVISEVEIGTDDPILNSINPYAELWYDTDAPAALLDDQRWNTAWGIIAQTALNSTYALTTSASTIASLTANTVAGRRYVVTAMWRTLEQVGAATGTAIVSCGGIPGGGMNDHYAFTAAVGVYGGGQTATWKFDGVGGSVTLNLVAQMTTGTGNMHAQAGPACWFLLEDAGPAVSTAAPLLTNPDARWNTAWGIVAVGSFTFGGGVSLTTNAAATNPITFTPRVGRRYRMFFCMGAMYAPSAATGYFIQRIDGVNQTVSDQYWQIIGATYTNWEAQWLIDGDGASHSYVVWYLQNAGPTVTGYGEPQRSKFYIEDVGPTSPYVPAPDPTPPWINLTLLNGWTNYPGGYPPASYRKIGDIVYLRGLLQNGTAATIAFTLPVGCRPAYFTHTASVANDAIATLRINTTGDVTLSWPGGWFALDGVLFSVTA